MQYEQGNQRKSSQGDDTQMTAPGLEPAAASTFLPGEEVKARQTALVACKGKKIN
jgi:hypothetical protein